MLWLFLSFLGPSRRLSKHGRDSSKRNPLLQLDDDNDDNDDNDDDGKDNDDN